MVAAPFIGTASQTLGRYAGDSASAAFGRIRGRGAYSVVHNSLVSGTSPYSYNLMHGRGAVRIRHREFITDVTVTKLFTIKTYNLNPADSATFPWCAAVAQNFEQWKALGIVFEYISTSSNALNSTDTALGSINLATQYNALSPDFTNKQEVLNYEFAVSVKPADSITHAVECDASETPNLPLYTRLAAVTPGDLRLYDLGKFSISSSGAQADSISGMLYINYDILLMKPKLPAPDSEDVMAHFFLPFNAATPMTGANPFGGATQPVTTIFEFPNEDGERVLCRPAVNQIRIPKGYDGNFSVQMIWSGTTYVPTTYLSFTSTNANPLSTLLNRTSPIQVANDPNGKMWMENIFSVIDPSSETTVSIIPDATAVLPVGASLDILLFQLNGAYA